MNFKFFIIPMQLFITDFEKKWESIKISDIEILSQVRKVLRMKIWDTFFVQNGNTRYKLEISDWDDKNIFWKILESIEHPKQIDEIWITIAMSNKRDKMETIVQKLSEIWIKNIFFRPSERSIIRERNEKKLDRLNKIAKEAIEQSRWRQLPKITFEKDISKIIEWKEVIVFDKSESNFKNIWTIKNALWIIWPEWGLTENDYKKFWEKIKTVSLGDTVLRTETASIIAARYLKNF